MFDIPLSTPAYVIGEMTSTFDSLSGGVSAPKPAPAASAAEAQESIPTPVSCRSAADLFRALGDVSRLKTLMLLTRQELCVTDLASELGEGLSTVSQRLRLLRSERLVAQRRVGKHVFYALADQQVAALIEHALEYSKPH